MLLNFLFLIPCLYGMEAIDYSYFFDLCKQGNVDDVKTFIKQHPTIDLNHQNEHGTTPALHASTWKKWDCVKYLLRKHKINKMMPDNYGQTIFSKAVYGDNFWILRQLLGGDYYSQGELNTLCKNMCLNRSTNNEAEQISTFVSDALAGKQDINSKNDNNVTALHVACSCKHIPIIIQLLERGADLDIESEEHQCSMSSYDLLQPKTNGNKSVLFVVREAFNSGPYTIPATALMNHMFETTLQEHMPSDVTNHIKQFYAQLIFFESPKARIWKYVAQEACILLGMTPADLANKTHCLTTILFLPQQKLTEINMRQLALYR